MDPETPESESGSGSETLNLLYSLIFPLYRYTVHIDGQSVSQYSILTNNTGTGFVSTFFIFPGGRGKVKCKNIKYRPLVSFLFQNLKEFHNKKLNEFKEREKNWYGIFLSLHEL